MVAEKFLMNSEGIVDLNTVLLPTAYNRVRILNIVYMVKKNVKLSNEYNSGS